MILTALGLKSAGAIVKKIPRGVWLTLGMLLLLVGSHYYAYHKGESKVQTEWNASIERGRGLVADLKKNQGKIETVIVTQYVDRVKVIHEKGETIEKLIPYYIPANTPLLPGGFRVLHDAAATNTIPESSTRVGAFPVAIEDVAKTMNFNYELCHVERQKLSSLWEWALKNRHAYLELCKQQGVVCK